MSVDLPTAKWFKSSRSHATGDYVEVAHLTTGAVGVRDSKNPTGPALVFTPAEWDAFTTVVQDGRFEAPAQQPEWPGPAIRSQRSRRQERRPVHCPVVHEPAKPRQRYMR
ncbi:DUF397 domain-containing protein [Nocardia sp. BSTN01]|uniref:DUF397 domain-containing protein n=1 Tax=Nocardia sp. BSTN01 TaxID=2783665 RepID=UPI00188E675F|nr:DUF397 domain-containing protein [Nocardia sp. BSTN01]MBF4999464.1 DUF397 domain-containing protein [Nocardia sp. BSTN01]